MMTADQFRYERHLYSIQTAFAEETGKYAAGVDIRRTRRGTPGGKHAVRFTLPAAFETKERAMAAGNRAAKK